MDMSVPEEDEQLDRRIISVQVLVRLIVLTLWTFFSLLISYACYLRLLLHHDGATIAILK